MHKAAGSGVYESGQLEDKSTNLASLRDQNTDGGDISALVEGDV